MGSEQPARLKMTFAFSIMVAPQTEQARREMEERLLQYGCNLPIRVWNNTVLVDQEEYLFCRSHNLPLNVKKMRFRNQYEAVIWICKNQLRRADLLEEMRKYLIGRRTQAERALHMWEIGRQSESVDKEGSKSENASVIKSGLTKLIEKLGAEYHVSSMTIRNYKNYAKTIDHLFTVEPALAKRMLHGQLKISHENMLEIAQMNNSEISRLAKYFLSSTDTKPNYARYKMSLAQNKQKREDAGSSLGGIKEMPKYDPDAEVSSLALTIPSWVDSVHRTERGADLRRISERARERLICELDGLVYSVEGLLSILKEDSNG